MNHLLLSLLLAFISLTAGAQCTYENHAFTERETINYNLYFNWQFVWIGAGTATMNTAPIKYGQQNAFRTRLVTATSKKVDRYFRMRDTIMVYFTKQLTPLYYRKGASEGKRYYVDEVWYTYPNGNCHTRVKHLTSSGETVLEGKSYNHCVSDMLNSFQRVRNMDPTGWREGHVIPLDIAGGSELVKAKLIYRGKKTVKGDDNKKYNCLVLSYCEKDGKKDKEIVKFFVTDDHRHVPVRLDLNLKFGTAKAILSSVH